MLINAGLNKNQIQLKIFGGTMRLRAVILASLGFCAVAEARVVGRNFINGREAQPGDFPEVVYTNTNGIKCTGTLVGPRVLVTAATCGKTGDVAKFQVGQTLYNATITRSPNYEEGNPGKEHNLAIGLIDKEITNIAFASVGGTAEVEKEITLAGYGCVTTNGEGGGDGILRYGDSTIKSFDGYDMISYKQGGGALCFGDFGGPTYLKLSNPKAGHHFMVGINSNGNIKDANWSTRTDIPESQDFFKNYADANQVSICGINKDCAGGGPGPGPGTCAEQIANLDNSKQLLNIRMDTLVACMSTGFDEMVY
jgi:hypothetical protein